MVGFILLIVERVGLVLDNSLGNFIEEVSTCIGSDWGRVRELTRSLGDFVCDTWSREVSIWHSSENSLVVVDGRALELTGDSVSVHGVTVGGKSILLSLDSVLLKGLVVNDRICV